MVSLPGAATGRPASAPANASHRRGKPSCDDASDRSSGPRRSTDEERRARAYSHSRNDGGRRRRESPDHKKSKSRSHRSRS